MNTAISGKWHAWEGTAGVLLSDEDTKKLRNFPDIDMAVNWLYLSGEKEAARTINRAWKET